MSHTEYETYFRFPLAFNPSTIDFDKFGILFQLQDGYYTICEIASPEANQPDASLTLAKGWLTAAQLGPYILEEWASLPKVTIGRACCGVEERSRRVAAHSATMQQLRMVCLAKVQQLYKEMRREQGGGEIRLQDLKTRLDVLLPRTVEIFFGALRMHEEWEKESLEVLAKEWLVFDEDDREGKGASIEEVMEKNGALNSHL